VASLASNGFDVIVTDLLITPLVTPNVVIDVGLQHRVQVCELVRGNDECVYCLMFATRFGIF
jgi:hypothetical protein